MTDHDARKQASMIADTQCDGLVEVDPDAKISRPDDPKAGHVYVQAWILVEEE